MSFWNRIFSRGEMTSTRKERLAEYRALCDKVLAAPCPGCGCRWEVPSCDVETLNGRTAQCHCGERFDVRFWDDSSAATLIDVVSRYAPRRCNKSGVFKVV